MSVLKDDYHERLQRWVDDKKKLDLLYRYYELLVRKNKDINLVSRKDTKQVVAFHIYYSIVGGSLISIKPKDKLLDIGTGAGLPSIPLAIIYPKATFHAVDSISKKVNAVTSFVEDLKLDNVCPFHSRLEQCQLTGIKTLLSKSVAPLSVLLSWSESMVKRNSKTLRGLWCWKGGDVREEIAKAGRRAKSYPLKVIDEGLDDKLMLHVPLNTETKQEHYLAQNR